MGPPPHGIRRAGGSRRARRRLGNVAFEMERDRLLGLLFLWGTVAAFWVIVWLTIPKDTSRRRLRAWPLRRLFRAMRSVLARLGALPLAWPHVVDVLCFGAGRRHVGAPADVVWQDGRVTLTRFQRGRGGLPVLVVHALVTKPWILDLTPTRSFVGALCDAGFDVFLLDWGDPDGRDAGRGLTACADVVTLAEAKVRGATGAAAGSVHAVGYCLGATVVLVALAGGGLSFASATLLAPMVDFGVPGGLQRMLSRRSLRPVLALDSGSCVPAALVREGFHFLRPQALRTVWRRARRGGSPEERSFYAAMARWAWSHRRLPGATFFDLVAFYRHNPLMPTAGAASPLATIRTPLLVAVAERDHIVPCRSSLALASVPGLDVTVLSVASGHVSMLVGSAARTTFWPGVVAFVRAHAEATAANAYS